MSNLFGSDLFRKFYGLYALLVLIFAALLARGQVEIHVGVILASWFFIYILGIEIGYHRLFSHRSFDTAKPAEYLLAIFGLFAGQGSAIYWIANHRAHHRFSDTAKDPHSPTRGLLRAILFWQFEPLPEGRLHYAKELLHNPFFFFLHKYHYKIFWMVSGVVGLIGPSYYFNLILAPVFLSRVASSAINVMGHSRFFGYQSFNVQDNSKNFAPMGLAIFGLGWHNFHHAYPKEPYLPLNLRRRFYEIDPSAPIIMALRSLSPSRKK